MLQEHGGSMVTTIGHDSSGNLLERGSDTSHRRQPETNITIASATDKPDVLMESQEDDVTFATRVAGGERCTCGCSPASSSSQPCAGGRRFINQQCGRRRMQIHAWSISRSPTPRFDPRWLSREPLATAFRTPVAVPLLLLLLLLLTAL
jgi:hypothetical protein